MACPAVAGAGALARQYFEEGWYPTGTPVPEDSLSPSGALVKATLLNSTVDMTGVAGYPSDLEGWGRTLLENALFFANDARRLAVLENLRTADGLSTDDDAAYPLFVEGTQETLKITLVYTEPAAALLASLATVNDLDLEVRSPSGTLYLGNVMNLSTGVSTTGGSPLETACGVVRIAKEALGTGSSPPPPQAPRARVVEATRSAVTERSEERGVVCMGGAGESGEGERGRAHGRVVRRGHVQGRGRRRRGLKGRVRCSRRRGDLRRHLA